MDNLKDKIKLITRLTLRLVIILFLAFWHKAFALEENTKLWTKLDVDGYLSRQHHLKYWLDAQLRFVSKHDHYELALLEAMIGYGLTPQIDFWLGYRRSRGRSHALARDRNTIWQEVDYAFLHCAHMKWDSRTRFEQQKPTNSSVWLLHIRQRLKVALPILANQHIVPAIWDEVFFNLNNTPYATHDFVSQNRLFLGFDFIVAKNQILEIGYVNQYIFNSAANLANQMNHVLFLDYNFNFM